mgnify:CR=1 FL=1
MAFLTPKSKLRLAIQYGTKRETELRVFLEDPDLPMDTNDIERETNITTQEELGQRDEDKPFRDTQRVN